MGDRTTCTLYVTGAVTQSQFDAIAKAVTAYDSYVDPKGLLHDGEGFLEFEEVNYGIMPGPLGDALMSAGVTYGWINEPGSSYSGAIIAHCEGKTVELPLTDWDVMIPVCAIDNPEAVKDARFAQDVHDRLTGDGLTITG